ncbi:MAG: hypothetical protein U1F43_02945 [Myxococcota bacterium]
MHIDPRLRVAWERFIGLVPIFAVLAAIAVWVLSALLLEPLPGPIPIHFDTAGNPNGSGPWWILAALGTGLLLAMAGAVALTRRLARTSPQWINLPAKAAFVALPADARLRIVGRVGQLLIGFALILNLVLLTLVRDTYRIAQRELATLPLWKLGLLVGLAVVWVVVGILRVRNAIRSETASAASAASAA